MEFCFDDWSLLLKNIMSKKSHNNIYNHQNYIKVKLNILFLSLAEQLSNFRLGYNKKGKIK